MREKQTTVLDELVFVGRSGSVDEPSRPLVPVIADPEVEADLTVGQRVARFAVLTLLSATIILIIGLGVGYAA